ncbi:MAG: SUMF1/EgtB/PvdO family nonheme iron enzyme, partial [bacterium]|nr:SUMF1/EgtB/PvdO family nonheme iron enzyme [bacterium]
AEWEYACRAGTTTEFNVGTDLDCADARFDYSFHGNGSCGISSAAGTIDVGSYPANAFGLHDMHGNVMEWCLDNYSLYSSGAVTDPFVAGSPGRVFRGGSWAHSSDVCRSASRHVWNPNNSNRRVGFRVVLAPENPQRAGMVLIPAGTFSMGSDAPTGLPYNNNLNQQPVHYVTISQDFWMGEHEVTQAEYQALMGSNPSHYFGPNLPVEQVSWNDAVAYCTVLTAQEMAAGNLQTGYEYRLPKEAEWEYACRAGTTTEFNVGSDLFCSQARFSYSYHPSGNHCGVSTSAGTIDVGAYFPNDFGLYDMHGNVWEWCLDSYASYNSAPVTDPFVTGGSNRVIRGGSWNSPSSYCRSACRFSTNSGSSSLYVGFRVVLAPENPPPAGMVLIPAGTFSMGSDAPTGLPYNNSSNQQPVHDVTISQDFWMGEHEVTQAEYQALMSTNPSYFSGPGLPVETVSWHDARAYCTALTAQQMAAGDLPAGYEYRLPTEAEWEYACRAETTTEFNVGSDLFCSQARFWYSYHPSGNSCGVNSSAGTIDVGSYLANDFGLYDMHGSVWEWCLDSYASYGAAAVTDPFVTGGSSRVIRGGSWYNVSYHCRSAYRSGSNPGNAYDNFGFRVVLAPVLVP